MAPNGPAAPNGRDPAGPRCFAIVGPFQSGKTTLLEAILERTGAISRSGRVSQGDSVGDSSAEARAHAMTVEPNVATVSFLGEVMTFIDCPGSVEFLHDMRNVAPVCDAAVVVCEADERKIPALEILLRELEEANVPRFLFINKIDSASRRLRETLALLQKASRTPLLLRQIPIWKDGIAVGFIDLALERAFIYREHAASEVVAVPEGELPREREARFAMLEKLADYDDDLMEELISEIEPPQDRVFDDLAKELKGGHVVPALIGSADRGNGVTRLLKALRHEAPGLAQTRERLGLSGEGPALAQVVKTLHAGQGGKLSVARVLRGAFREGETVLGSRGQEARIASLFTLVGSGTTRVQDVQAGGIRASGAWRASAARTRSPSERPGRRRWPPSSRRVRSTPSHSRSGTERTTSACPAPWRRSSRRIRPCPSRPAPIRARSGCTARARCTCGSPSSGSPPGSRSRWRPPVPMWPIARRSGCRPRPGGGTRSRPADMASSATWRSRSRRCRVAKGSRSRTTSRAEWSRANISRASRRGCGTPSAAAPLDTRWSISRFA